MNFVQPIRSREKIEQIKVELRKDEFYGARNLLLFCLGINFGLRISDHISLRVSDVRGKDKAEITEQKTGKTRIVPINDDLRRQIADYIKDRPDTEYLFSSRKKDDGESQPITRQQAYRIIQGACRAVDIIDKIGTHTLRKSFGYHHYQQYKDIALLMSIFGHSHPSITLRYIGISEDEIMRSCMALAL